jgi:mono/diheme cytochrome c family protein
MNRSRTFSVVMLLAVTLATACGRDKRTVVVSDLDDGRSVVMEEQPSATLLDQPAAPEVTATPSPAEPRPGDEIPPVPSARPAPDTPTPPRSEPPPAAAPREAPAPAPSPAERAAPAAPVPPAPAPSPAPAPAPTPAPAPAPSPAPAPAPAAPPAAPAAQPTASVSDGAAVFRARCASCHGADGRGETATGKKLGVGSLTAASVQNASDARLTEVIRNGTDEASRKAHQSRKLTSEQLRDVIAFIRSLE